MDSALYTVAFFNSDLEVQLALNSIMGHVF